MERDGQIVVNARGMYLASSSADFIAGKVLGHRDGFGFLSRDDGGPDLFLAPREMLKVVHGDRVLVKPDGDYRGKPEGLIIEVLEHRTIRLFGRFLRERVVNIVVPEDQRIKHDVLIAAVDTMGAGHGQVVVAEIIQQPTRHTQPVGRIVEVLGEIDDPGMEIEIAVRKFDVPVDFSERAQRQAARIPDVVRPADIKGRVDLRSVPFITIDGEDARDFDDAVYGEAINIGTERRRRPAWGLLVAISDVSHYGRPGDWIDLDALERGTSVYFPRRVIPMLPEVLSNGICSLDPNEDRLVLVCDMVIPGNGVKAGQVSAYQFYTAVIRSHARTTYDQVWTALQQPDGPAAKEILDVLPQIQELYQLFHVQEQARVKRGAIEFDTVETRILATPLGRIEEIVPVERNDAHRIIEECMLAANTCAADFMRRNRRQGLYRVHEGPTPEKLSALRDYLRTLGLRLGGGDDPSPQDFADLMVKLRERPDFHVVQTMVLRSLQQAIYSPEQMGHFGLAYEGYAHFTAPIRRYPDLLTHRVIKSILEKKRYIPDVEDAEELATLPKGKRTQAIWEKLGLLCSARERRAEEASRDVEAWLKCWFMREHIGEIFSGHVTGVAPFGLFITLNTLFVEGMVHVSELGSDYFQYNEATHELLGERTGIRYRLTSAVQVQVARVDLEARRIDFQLVKGTSYKAVKQAITQPKKPAIKRIKKAASTKPAALKGTTASERRAAAKRAAKKSASKSGRRSR